MKRLLLLLGGFIFVLNAQVPDQAYLVNSMDIGEDLLLFVPDTSVQILRNPARATNYKNGFVFLTKTDYSSRNIYSYSSYAVPYMTGLKIDPKYLTAINVNYLFGQPKNKWLLSLLSRDNNQNLKDFDKNQRFDISINYSRNLQDSSKIKSNLKSSLHQISLNKTGSMDSVNYSFGLIAGLEENENVYNRTNTSKQTDYNEMQVYNRLYNSDSDTKEKMNRQYLGAEFGLSADSWDLTSSLIYSKVNYKDITNSYYNYRYFDYDSITVLYRSDQNNQVNLNSNTFNADIIEADIYFRKNTSLFSQKADFFLGLNGVFSKDKQKLGLQVNEMGEIIYTSPDTSLNYDYNVAGNGSSNNTDQKYNLRAGYLLNHTGNDIYILTGLTGLFAFSKQEMKSIQPLSDKTQLSDMKFEESFYQLELPVYFNFSPVNWFNVYAGYHLSYIYQDYLLTEKVSDSSAELIRRNDRQNFGSYQKTYLGINMKNKSGLRVQIGFNGTLTSYKSWNFSLGYIF